MATVDTINPIESELWPQRDARDPLGIWGFRELVTGDATGGSAKVIVTVPAERRHAFVYTIYSASIQQTNSGAVVTGVQKLRILTNWPNIDVAAGIDPATPLHLVTISGSSNFTFPSGGPRDAAAVPTLWRFIPLFDPSTQGGNMDLIELEFSANSDGVIFQFEGWGYYWDRAVMTTPGGLRHPGTN